MLTFDRFKEHHVARIFVGSLGPVAGANDKRTWLDVLDNSVSFTHFRHSVIAYNGALMGTKHFVDSVNATSGAAMLSKTQFQLLCAFCAMVDFGHVADELVKKRKKEGVWESLYTSMDPVYAEVLATMVYEAAIA